MKTCSKCGAPKDESQFHKRRDSKDGLQPSCRQCQISAKKNRLLGNQTEKALLLSGDAGCPLLTKVILTCLLGPEDPKGWERFMQRPENEHFRVAKRIAAKQRSPGKKVCTKCRRTKDKTEFHQFLGNPDGLNYHCKLCACERARGYRLKNLDKHRERDRKDSGNPARRSAKLLSAYGLSLVEYNTLLSGQNGVCAICKKEESVPRKKNLTVDHDHSTGKVRGLLCHFCNAGLGFFKDSSSITQAATEYLLKPRS